MYYVPFDHIILIFTLFIMNPPESFIFYYVILNIRCENVICLEELRPQILSMFDYPSSLVSQ